MQTLIYAGREFTIDDAAAHQVLDYMGSEDHGYANITTSEGRLTIAFGKYVPIALLRER